MKQKKKTGRFRVSAAGYILICYLCIGAIWPIDAGIRWIRKPDVHPAPGEGIIADGTFGEDAEKSGVITIEMQPETDAGTAEVQADTASGERVINEASTTLAAAITLPANCVAVPQESRDTGNGKLLLLDSTRAFEGTAAGLVTFEEKDPSYRVRYMELQARSEVVDAMNRMASAYESCTGATNLMVYSTTAACEAAGSLYPDQLPDSATGYCVDLCLRNEDETLSPIEEGSPWLTYNAHLYGFIRPYTRAEEELTGIASAPYHLRYVGKVHACIMHEEDLTLNGYLDMLHEHTISNPYHWTDGSRDWSIYYVPDSLGGTEVPVPLNANYEISGNNTDGFIVTAEGRIGE